MNLLLWLKVQKIRVKNGNFFENDFTYRHSELQVERVLGVLGFVLLVIVLLEKLSYVIFRAILNTE